MSTHSLLCIFFLLYGFFSLCFFSFLLLEKKKMLGEILEIEMRKHSKWKCKSRKAEAEAKSERVEWELEGKLPPYS